MNQVRPRILKALEEHGPMSSAALQVRLGLSQNLVSRALCELRKPGKTVPKRIYIREWKRCTDGGKKLYIRAIFDLGNLPCKKKNIERQTGAEKQRRVRENAKIVQANSVFSLGIPTRTCYKQRGQFLKAQKVGTGRVYIDGKAT